MSMGARYGWLVCCLLSGCYAEHDGLLECDGPEETTWPCEGDVTFSAVPPIVCHLEDGTWMAAIDHDTPFHCEALTRAPSDVVFRAREAACVEPGVIERRSSVCGAGPDDVAFDRSPLRIPPLPVELPAGRCVAMITHRSSALADRYEPQTDYALLCDDPLARCGAPLVFDVHLAGYDPCAGARYLERCEVEVEGARLIVAVDATERARIGCEPAIGDRVATCVAPPLGAGTYTVIDTAGRVLGDLEVPLEQDAPREPRCIAIE